MTAMKPCAGQGCLAPTARDTAGLLGVVCELLCEEHAARALGLPVDAFESLARAVTPICQHLRCEEPAKEITTWGSYCARHFMLRCKK